MRKIMFIIPSFASGGAERAVANLSSQLAKSGEDVTVVIYFRMKDEYDVDRRVKVINLSGGDEKQYASIPYFTKIRMLRKIIKSCNPDYILPFLPQITIHATLAGFDLYHKIIHTLRNNPAITPPNRIKRFLCNTIICTSWKTIVQNEEQKEFYPALFHHKIYTLFNPVSQQLIDIQKDYRTEINKVIAVGRLDEQKNFSMLIRAFREVVSKHPSVELEIYGEGQLKDELNREINDLGLATSIHLMGRSNNMKTVYQNADLFVLTSNYEGMPNTLIEAMAVGLPCISTDCETGPADLIENNQNGLLVPVGDDHQLAVAIMSMIDDPYGAIVKGKKAKQTVFKKCGIESICGQLIEICEK